MHQMDQGNLLNGSSNDRRQALLLMRREAQVKEVDANLAAVLPHGLAQLVESNIAPEHPKEFRAHRDAVESQGEIDNVAINAFVEQVRWHAASDYAQGGMLLVYGRLFMSFSNELHINSNNSRFMEDHLAEEIAKQRDLHADEEMSGLLDEALALFCPAKAKGQHDLTKVLLRAADGFIEAASMPSERDPGELMDRFVDSWKVLYNRVDHCDFADKEGLRKTLLKKLMAFADQHPERSAWVRGALRYSKDDHEEALKKLWRLETPARLMADADKAIKDLVDGKSSTAKFGNKWKELRDEVEKVDREEWDGLRAPLLARLRAFAAENDEQTESIHAARLSFAPTPVPPPRSFRQP
jgi:hypothetical protein